MILEARPKVLSLRHPQFAGDAYLKECSKYMELDVLEASTREEARQGIKEKVATSGPYFGFMMLFNTRPYEPFDEELLCPIVPDCKIFVSASAGYNEFDVDWLTRNGILFCNTIDGVAEATADMAIFLILAALRDTSRAEKSAREGKWKNDFQHLPDPSGKVLGIVGLGMIGKYVARKAPVFHMKVQYYSRRRLSSAEESELGVEYCSSFETLLETSDIISVHCPLNPETVNLISYGEFARMKDGVFFINTSRGPIVDEEALIGALKSGKIKRAGLDVFRDEPNIHPYFLESDKCTIQPHLGGITQEACKRSERECFENLKSFLANGKPVSAVNKV